MGSWVEGGAARRSWLRIPSLSPKKLRELTSGFFKRFIYLFIHDIHGGAARRHRQREKQAPRCQEPNAGLNSGTLGSCPGPKAGAKPLSNPGIPSVVDFRWKWGIMRSAFWKDLSGCRVECRLQEDKKERLPRQRKWPRLLTSARQQAGYGMGDFSFPGNSG